MSKREEPVSKREEVSRWMAFPKLTKAKSKKELFRLSSESRVVRILCQHYRIQWPENTDRTLAAFHRLLESEGHDIPVYFVMNNRPIGQTTSDLITLLVSPEKSRLIDEYDKAEDLTPKGKQTALVFSIHRLPQKFLAMWSARPWDGNPVLHFVAGKKLLCLEELESMLSRIR